MNIWSPECSSGCESGWTTYFDQISNSTNYVQQREANVREDEDLSMVSDASSGPPNYVSEPHYYAYESSLKKDTKKTKTKEKKLKNQNSFCLDDTASSSILHFSQDNAVPPQSHISGNNFQGESIQKKRLGFLKSSTKRKSGSFLGRKRQ